MVRNITNYGYSAYIVLYEVTAFIYFIAPVQCIVYCVNLLDFSLFSFDIHARLNVHSYSITD